MIFHADNPPAIIQPAKKIIAPKKELWTPSIPAILVGFCYAGASGGGGSSPPDSPPGGGSYSGPGDITPSAIGFWGLRAYSGTVAATATQKACRVVDGSNANALDILLLTTGFLDEPSLNTWIGVHGTAHVTTIYDQSGNGNDLTQATVSNMPTITQNAINTNKSALNFSAASGQVLAGALQVAAQAAPFTLYGVVNRGSAASAPSVCATHNFGVVVLGSSTSANTLNMYSGNGADITSGVTDNSWMSYQGMFTASSTSKSYVNGNQTTGLNAGANNLGTDFRIGDNFFGNFWDGKIVEVGAWLGDKSANFSALENSPGGTRNATTGWNF